MSKTPKKIPDEMVQNFIQNLNENAAKNEAYMKEEQTTIYTLALSNAQGAAGEDKGLVGKAAVRLRIRTWRDAESMTAKIYGADDLLVYEGAALEF